MNTPRATRPSENEPVHLARTSLADVCYDGFGPLIGSDPAGAPPVSEAEANLTDRGVAVLEYWHYDPAELDVDTDFCIGHARAYDPTLGRWCAEDPIAFRGPDTNLYRYCPIPPATTEQNDGSR